MESFFFQAEDGIRDRDVTGVQTCALPILGRQQVLHLLVRRPAGDRGRGDGGSAVPVPGSTDAQGGRRSGMIMPAPWQRWDWHASVVIGLALLGGLYAYLGGLAAPRRRVLAFGAALGVLGVALNGPLHNLSDGYLFSAHMVQHLVLTLVFPPLLLYGAPV